MKIVRDNKNLYMDILINGYLIASITGIESIELKGDMITYTTSEHGNLNFIHHVEEIKENIKSKEYIQYHVIVNTKEIYKEKRR